MPVLHYNDDVTTIEVVSAQPATVNSTVFKDFITAIYLFHALVPLGSYVVQSLGGNEYTVVFTSLSGRVFPQRLKKFGATWQTRQDGVSDYFTLAELLQNNFTRTALQDMIGAFNLESLSVTFM